MIHCLKAWAWGFLQASSFREAILCAVNQGDDADTTGAVCGQLAGAFYGEEGIPSAWLAHLVMAEEIRSLADRLAQSRSAAQYVSAQNTLSVLARQRGLGVGMPLAGPTG